jgi:hypothetical protein
MDWTGYEVFDPEVDRPLREVTRAEARRHFEKLMAEREDRKAALRALVERATGSAPADGDAYLDHVEDWLRGAVEPHPELEGRMDNEWYSVFNDLALELGDLAIADSSWLRWELDGGGKRKVSFQRPVLAGFRVPAKGYTFDLDLRLTGFGHGIALGDPEPERLLVPLRANLGRQARGEGFG